MTPAHDDAMVHETPFHPRVAAACRANLWYPWKGYTTVEVYDDAELEYFALRNTAGVFDLTPMSKYRITGPDAGAFLDRLVTRDLSRLAVGRVAYCAWCDDAGHVLDDGTVFRLEADRYRLCSQERHLDWLSWAAIGFDVEIADETAEVAALALQGPTACAVLKAMGLAGVERLRPFHLTRFDFQGGELLVSRTGFTGDLGYELWVAPERALALWDALMAAGAALHIRPVGARALDVARLEAGFIQAGVDFVPAAQAVRPGRGRSPFELGLGWLVDFDKGNFNGRRALLAERARGSRYRLVRLDVAGNKPAHDALVFAGTGRRRQVGTVTSATWSPTAKANIALASVTMPWGREDDTLWAEIYYSRELQWSREMARCRVIRGAFFDPPRRRQTPAPDY